MSGRVDNYSFDVRRSGRIEGSRERGERGRRTSVPMIRGDFIIAQRAKWARFSSIVKSPLPTSSMSGSLWPQKSTLDSS